MFFENKTLIDLIYTVPFWHTVDGCLLPALTLSRAYPDSPMFSKDDFASVDVRLLEVLSGMNKRFSGHWLTMALEYWNNKKVFLPGRITVGAFREADIPVHRLIDFAYNEDPLSEVEVRFRYYTLRYSSTGVPYPALTSEMSATYPQALLDTYLLNWKRRFEVARGMELEPEAMTRFIVDSPSDALPEVLPTAGF